MGKYKRGKIMEENSICVGCNKKSSELEEYVEAAKEINLSPEEYVRLEEGTYNRAHSTFYCSECYVKLGMPLGKAPGPKSADSPGEIYESYGLEKN